MDHHAVAAVSITGTCLDVLGTLYLAYDLLGGQHGPLRGLTRAVTYSIIFGIGWGLGLGLFFGLATGAATGVTLAIEFNRAARGLDRYSLPWESTIFGDSRFAFGGQLLVLAESAVDGPQRERRKWTADDDRIDFAVRVVDFRSPFLKNPRRNLRHQRPPSVLMAHHLGRNYRSCCFVRRKERLPMPSPQGKRT